MFQVLEEREGNVLGVEIRDEHTKEDKEDVEELKKIFEGSIAEGHDRVNVPFKIDKPATQLGYFTSIFRRETLEGDKRSVFCDSPGYQEKQHEKTKGRSKQSAKRNAQKKRAGSEGASGQARGGRGHRNREAADLCDRTESRQGGYWKNNRQTRPHCTGYKNDTRCRLR